MNLSSSEFIACDYQASNDRAGVHDLHLPIQTGASMRLARRSMAFHALVPSGEAIASSTLLRGHRLITHRGH